jgi:hypothetical protein
VALREVGGHLLQCVTQALLLFGAQPGERRQLDRQAGTAGRAAALGRHRVAVRGRRCRGPLPDVAAVERLRLLVQLPPQPAPLFPELLALLATEVRRLQQQVDVTHPLRGCFRLDGGQVERLLQLGDVPAQLPGQDGQAFGGQVLVGERLGGLAQRLGGVQPNPVPVGPREDGLRVRQQGEQPIVGVAGVGEVAEELP